MFVKRRRATAVAARHAGRPPSLNEHQRSVMRLGVDPVRWIRKSSGPRSSQRPLIGVGKRHWLAAPLPPNRTGRSPAAGSPVGGFPQRGLTYLAGAAFRLYSSACSAKGLGPATLVAPVATDPLAPLPLAQQTPQPPPYPPVQTAEHDGLTAAEVRQPTFQRPVQVAEDTRQAAAIGSFRLATHGLLQLCSALGTQPAASPVKTVAQKVERLRAGIDEAPSCPGAASGRWQRPTLARFQGPLCLRPRTAQNDKSSGPGGLHPQASRKRTWGLPRPIRLL